jgi:hypothetical protein
MTMKNEYRVGATLLRATMLAGAAVALIGCDSIREAAGVTKEAPDEFAVVTKAPLVIPPDFNLRPPKPGAAPTNQTSPTDSAQTALFGDDPATIASSLPNTYSPEEKIVLATTGAAEADHSIRQQIAADAKSMATVNDSFTDQLLFFDSPDPDAGHPIDADVEHDRLAAAKASGETPTTGQNADTDKKASGEAATISKDSSGDDNVHSGWFDGWFDGIF